VTANEIPISRHISIVIDADPQQVYDYVADPDHLRDWAAGLAAADEVRRDGDELIVQSPMGTVRVRFAETNAYGVLDHWVTLPTGDTVYNPLRVIAHPAGAEVIFTVRQLNSTDGEFDADCAAVARDLQSLREILSPR
jgi:hypothetical protein